MVTNERNERREQALQDVYKVLEGLRINDIIWILDSAKSGCSLGAIFPNANTVNEEYELLRKSTSDFLSQTDD